MKIAVELETEETDYFVVDNNYDRGGDDQRLDQDLVTMAALPDHDRPLGV